MKTRKPIVPTYYEILAGGPEGFQGLKLSKSSHMEGYIRRSLFVQNAITLMDRGGLERKDLPAITEIIHTPSSLLDDATPWNYAVVSNLHFYFARSVLRKSISELTNKDVQLTFEEQEAVDLRLRPIISYGRDFSNPCEFH